MGGIEVGEEICRGEGQEGWFVLRNIKTINPTLSPEEYAVVPFGNM